MNLHFLYTRLSMDLMRPLVNRWPPFTHVSYCTTTSRPAAATQTRTTRPAHNMLCRDKA